MVVKDDAIDSIEMVEEVQTVDVKEEVVKNDDEEEEEVMGHKDSNEYLLTEKFPLNYSIITF